MLQYRSILPLTLALVVKVTSQTPANIEPAKADYSKEAYVIEEDSNRVVFENDGTSTREAIARVRLQSNAGVQHFGLLTFPYSNATETVEINYVRVHKPDGSTVVTPPENVQDMASEITRAAPFYTDLREKHVAVKGLGTGDVLEYQARWRTTKPLIPGQFWFAYNFSDDAIILKEQVRIDVPRDRTLKWKSPEYKPVISEEKGRRVFTWTNSNLQLKPTQEKEEEEEKNALRAATGTFPAADIQLSTFQT